jgi:NitT/TauT family transport system permease protein
MSHAIATRGWFQRLAPWLPLVVFLALWQILAGTSDERRFFYSTPLDVGSTLWHDIADGSLPRHAGVTASEALVGFVLGNLIGAVIGISLWYFESVARISKPYLVALASFPVFSIAPMTILWFGIAWKAKMILALLAVVFLAIAQAYKGAEQVDRLLLRRFLVLGASRWTIFRRLLLPTAIVWIIGSLRITIGSALLGAFIGELISSDQGLGYLITRASGIYDTSRVLCGVLTIIALALVLDWLVTTLERRLLRWQHPQTQTNVA